MRKWIVLVLVAAGCSRAPVVGTSLTGAATPRDAATLFLNAVRAQDLQAMSTVWGDANGPARDQMDRAEVDQRLVLMQACYNHDRFTMGDLVTTPDGRRTVRIEVARGARTKTPTFEIVQGPSSRWYVKDADYGAMGDFCTR